MLLKIFIVNLIQIYRMIRKKKELSQVQAVAVEKGELDSGRTLISQQNVTADYFLRPASSKVENFERRLGQDLKFEKQEK